MINTIFDECVQLLIWSGHAIGMSYKAINVWIFCVLWPLFTLALLVAVWRQRVTIARLRRQLGGQPPPGHSLVGAG